MRGFFAVLACAAEAEISPTLPSPASGGGLCKALASGRGVSGGVINTSRDQGQIFFGFSPILKVLGSALVN